MALKLGTIERGGEYGLSTRDAVHIGVALVCSSYDLKPGDSVQFYDDTFQAVRPASVENRHGVVDPFLKQSPTKYQDRFLILLEPKMVSQLTHTFDIDDTGVPSENCGVCRENEE